MLRGVTPGGDGGVRGDHRPNDDDDDHDDDDDDNDNDKLVEGSASTSDPS